MIYCNCYLQIKRKMRKVWLSSGDFELYHQDINPVEYDFFRTHVGTFKRMWQEQTRDFWDVFVKLFDHFLWQYGIMRDFPMTMEETGSHIDGIVSYLRHNFVEGKASTAKALILDCVVVAQNRNCIILLDKGSFSQNPFYMKETREIFRKLFGEPDDQKTYLKLLCGLQVYIKFAGSVVMMLRRWLEADEIDSDDDQGQADYLSVILRRRVEPRGGVAERRWGEKEVKKMMGESQQSGISDDKALSKLAHDKIIGHYDDGGKKRKKKKKTKSPSGSKTELVEITPIHTETTPIHKETTPTHTETPPTYKEAVNKLSTNDSTPYQIPKLVEAIKTNKEPVEAIKTKKEPVEAIKTKTEPVEVIMTKKELLEAIKTKKELLEAIKRKAEEKPLKDANKDSPVTQTHSESVDQKMLDSINRRHDDILHRLLVQDNDIGHVTTKKLEVLDHVIPPDATSHTDTLNIDKGGGAEIAKNDTIISTDVSPLLEVKGDIEGGGRKRLHMCHYCGVEETVAKSYKRCVKCRGCPNPCYYCSKECQVKHWKTHRLDHRADVTG